MLSHMTYGHNYIIIMPKKKPSSLKLPSMPKENKRTGKKRNKKKKTKKEQNLRGKGKKRRKKYNLATTHPSVTGQTPKCKPQERWIGVTGITGG